METVLLAPHSVSELAQLFRGSHTASFETILAPFVGMLERSRPLAAAFGAYEPFMEELARTLDGGKGGRGGYGGKVRFAASLPDMKAVMALEAQHASSDPPLFCKSPLLDIVDALVPVCAGQALHVHVRTTILLLWNW